MTEPTPSPAPDDAHAARAVRLDTVTLSDALDKLGIVGQSYRIRPRSAQFRMAAEATLARHGWH